MKIRNIVFLLTVLIGLSTFGIPVKSMLGANGVASEASAELPPLPDGIVAVEYLESTGTQWIDLGMVIGPDIEFEITAMITDYLANGCFFGGTSQFGWTGAGVGCSLAVTYKDEGRIDLRYGNNLTVTKGNRIIGFGNIFTAELKDNEFSINGQTIGTITRVESYWHDIATMGIFRRNFLGPNSNSTFVKGRIYSLRFGNVCNLLPVRVGNGEEAIGAMYDIISETLFYNAGTGSFIIGPDL